MSSISGCTSLQVVEACSGLRYLYPLMSLGFLAAYLFQAPLWQRVLVFLSTIPITIAMNSLRIGLVGVMVDHFGPQDADGFLHMFEGWIIFIACALVLVAEMYVLARFVSGKNFFDVFYPPKLPAGPAHLAAPAGRIRMPLLACFLLLSATAVAGAFVSARQEIVPERKVFVSFPDSLGEWRGRQSSLDPQTEHFLGLTDYILSDYVKRDGRSVNLYVAYYANQRTGVLAPFARGLYSRQRLDHHRSATHALRKPGPQRLIAAQPRRYRPRFRQAAGLLLVRTARPQNRQ